MSPVTSHRVDECRAQSILFVPGFSNPKPYSSRTKNHHTDEAPLGPEICMATGF